MDDLERVLVSVKSLLPRPSSSLDMTASPGAAGSEASGESDDTGVVSAISGRPRRLMEELDVTLHEVLDTVLAEAMARDVTHEVYQPRRERLDVLCLFHNFGSKLDRDERFPVVAVGPSIPYLMLDPQLLRYVHRNAISNACDVRSTCITLAVNHFKSKGSACNNPDAGDGSGNCKKEMESRLP